ncbi:hypothetical protein MKEN_00755500 [Mycena kentingensis (nom. inval.)]|nr:hypothetical protein MKEN_00755500 [Mycena kentingensis (nom. inval.)]
MPETSRKRTKSAPENPKKPKAVPIDWNDLKVMPKRQRDQRLKNITSFARVSEVNKQRRAEQKSWDQEYTAGEWGHVSECQEILEKGSPPCPTRNRRRKKQAAAAATQSCPTTEPGMPETTPPSTPRKKKKRKYGVLAFKIVPLDAPHVDLAPVSLPSAPNDPFDTGVPPLSDPAFSFGAHGADPTFDVALQFLPPALPASPALEEFVSRDDIDGPDEEMDEEDPQSELGDESDDGGDYRDDDEYFEDLLSPESPELQQDVEMEDGEHTPAQDSVAQSASDSAVGSPPSPPSPASPPSPPRPVFGPADDRPGYLRNAQRMAPTIPRAIAGLRDMDTFLQGKDKSGRRYFYRYVSLNPWVYSRLQGVRHLLWLYTTPGTPFFEKWMDASKFTCTFLNRKDGFATGLRHLARAWMDRGEIPKNPYGRWTKSRMEEEDVRSAASSHLQGLGLYIRALDVVDFFASPDVQRRFNMKKGISLATAKRWMRMMDYRWRTTAIRGQYVDGHERDDVVLYRQKVFIPKLIQHLAASRSFTPEGLDAFSITTTRVDGAPILGDAPEPDPTRPYNCQDPPLWALHPQNPAILTRTFRFYRDGIFYSRTERAPAFPFAGQHTVIWYHDESIFYAHDRRKSRWVHKSETPTPYTKGEGKSVMIAEYISADYGVLIDARRTWKPGKNRDGYFSSDEVIEQLEAAITLVKQLFPDDNHVFVYDNASTHLKRAEGALSARAMPRNTPAEGKNWGVEVTARDPTTGKPLHLPNGKLQKVKIRMRDTEYVDKEGNTVPQSLYFPDGHPRAGIFKGMWTLLLERGLVDGKENLRAQCGTSFKCKDTSPTARCCCRRILYNQPDFVNVESLIETLARDQGSCVLFLPKFHCEVNPIEQYWGHGKRLYRLNPPSSKEEDVIANALAALDSIPLDAIRKYCNRAWRFTDAYQKGLTGMQAAFAGKKYHGHRVVPPSIWEDMDRSASVASSRA